MIDKGIEIQHRCMKFRLGQLLVCQYLFVSIPLIKHIKKTDTMSISLQVRVGAPV